MPKYEVEFAKYVRVRLEAPDEEEARRLAGFVPEDQASVSHDVVVEQLGDDEEL